MLVVANFAKTSGIDAKTLKKNTKTLAYGYASESTQWELTNEYQHDRV